MMIYNDPYAHFGITADFARFLKTDIDAVKHLRPFEKLLAKQAISNSIGNPIDRDHELRSDRASFCNEIAQAWLRSQGD